MARFYLLVYLDLFQEGVRFLFLFKAIFDYRTIIEMIELNWTLILYMHSIPKHSFDSLRDRVGELSCRWHVWFDWVQVKTSPTQNAP